MQILDCGEFIVHRKYGIGQYIGVNTIKADDIIKEVKEKVDYIIVDFHAEASAEKIAMKYYLDGRITALYGTHTHVQTADEEITQKGTAFISDIGMTPFHTNSIAHFKREGMPVLAFFPAIQ